MAGGIHSQRPPTQQDPELIKHRHGEPAEQHWRLELVPPPEINAQNHERGGGDENPGDFRIHGQAPPAARPRRFCSRSSRRISFPVAVRGSESTNTNSLGILNSAIFSRTSRAMSSASASHGSCPGLVMM